MKIDIQHLPHVENIAYGGLMRTVTPDDVAEKLTQMGLAARKVGGLVATDHAHRSLLEMGRNPKPWQ